MNYKNMIVQPKFFFSDQEKTQMLEWGKGIVVSDNGNTLDLKTDKGYRSAYPKKKVIMSIENLEYNDYKKMKNNLL